MKGTDKLFAGKYTVILLAIFCNVLWGSAFVAVKAGYDQFHITESISEKLLFAGIRFTFAGLLVLLFSLASNRRLPVVHKDNLVRILLLGLVQTAIQYLFFYIGLSNTTGAKGSILNSASTFFAILLAHFIYASDKITKEKALGCILGFISVILLNWEGESLSFHMNGEGFLLIAAFTSALSSIISKKAVQTDDAMSVTGYNLTFGGLVLTAFGFFSGGRLHGEDTFGLLILLYLALLSAIAFTIWTRLLKSSPVGKLSLYNFVIPLTGTLLSGLFLKENILKPKFILALSLLILGILIVNRPKSPQAR